MKKIFFSILFVTLLGITFANNENEITNNPKAAVPTIELVGKVVDLQSGEALAGVEISIEGTDTKVYTDFDGNFKIENVKPGDYSLIASYISYKKSLIENFSANQENNELNIKLEETN